MEQIQNFAPVIIPTLNRYEHLRKCVESLSHNPLAIETELVIGLDYPPSEKYREGFEKIKEYLPLIHGFKKVTIFHANKNLGPSGNSAVLKKYVREQGYKSYIATEDDNVFSPCFLEFMNQGLQNYEDDPNVLSISGYSHLLCYKHPTSCYFSYNSAAWGIGVWFDKEDEIRKDFETNDYFYNKLYNWKSLYFLLRYFPSSVLMVLSVMDLKSSDVKRSIYNMFEKKYQLRPTISMVRNIGQDGSGLHSGVDEELMRQPIQEAYSFKIEGEITKANAPLNMKLYRTMSMPSNPINRLKYYPLVIYSLIKYKKRNKLVL